MQPRPKFFARFAITASRELPSRRATILIPYGLCLLICSQSRFGSADEDRKFVPADSAASPAAARLLEVLYEAGSDRTRRPWVGQNFGHANKGLRAGYRRNVQRLVEQTGRYPHLLGVDYGYDRIGIGHHEANQYLADHWQRNGIVTISMHPRNPWRWSTVHDSVQGDIDLLLQDGTAANRRWMGVLDRVAESLGQLQQENVAVLWRPLHEMNAGWFWWSGGTDGRRVTPLEFQRLWRQMFHYFVEKHQLHNLLWVYAPSAVYGESQCGVNDYYPGDNYVDVVGLDYYGDPTSDVLRHGIEQLSQHGKPVAISEFGFDHQPSAAEDNHKLVAAIKNLSVKPAYVMYWHSWDNRPVAIVDHRNADILLVNELRRDKARDNARDKVGD